jgi:acetylornithine deacetylase/succinyl-diaminopimelate desuccinylase-like protein
MSNTAHVHFDIRKIAESIEAKEVIDLSRELIRTPSVYKQEHKVAELVHKKLDGWGLDPEFVPVLGFGPDVVAQIGPRNAPCIVLNGHMDTVEVMTGWRHDPFGASIENGMLYGLGSLDMKCGLACLMVAMKTIAEHGLAGKTRIMLQAVTGEEDTGMGTRTLVESGRFKRAKAAILGEGFGGLGAVTHGRRGASYYDIVVQGKSAHGASPHKGINAIEDAAKIVEALSGMKMKRGRGKLADDFVPVTESQTVLRISGGKTSLSVPEQCSLYVVRYSLPGDQGDATEKLASIARGLKLRSKVTVKIQTGPHRYHSFLTSPESTLVESARESIQRFTGTKPRLVIGVSEADDNIIAHETGIPVVCMGPGETGVLAKYHQPEEAISIAQIAPAVRAIALTAMSLMQRA